MRTRRGGPSARYSASQRRDSHGRSGTRPAQRAWAAPSSWAKRASRGTRQSQPAVPATSASHSSTPPSERVFASADADPGQLATATLAALQGGMLLTQVRRSTEPLEAALDTVLAHVASLMTG